MWKFKAWWYLFDFSAAKSQCCHYTLPNCHAQIIAWTHPYLYPAFTEEIRQDIDKPTNSLTVYFRILPHLLRLFYHGWTTMWNITCHRHHLHLSESFWNYLIISDQKHVPPTILRFYHTGKPHHHLIVAKTQDCVTPLKPLHISALTGPLEPGMLQKARMSYETLSA